MNEHGDVSIPEGTLDVSALYGALDSRRKGRGVSWRELARELGLSASVFTRLAQGREPELKSYHLMTSWLGVSNDAFFQRERPAEAQSEDTVEKIATYLRADHHLKPESAQAIETIVRAAYEEMAESK